MADGKRKMHLAVQAAAPGHPAGWRVPGGERTAGDDVAHYQNADSGGSRPRIRDDVAHPSDLISLGFPR
jgi:hypothetical protein